MRALRQGALLLQGVPADALAAAQERMRQTRKDKREVDRARCRMLSLEQDDDELKTCLTFQ